MQIGSYHFDAPIFLAPMAGVTDAPFRALCQQQGAALTCAEMVSSKPELQRHWRTRLRLKTTANEGVIWRQLVGADPVQMAEAALRQQDLGTDILDINMGCPAKKVCKRAAGSALLADVAQVKAIIKAVVNAVTVPVTLKIRTGVTPQQRNALEIARIAEGEGIAALTVHGRTRACRFSGQAEYATLKALKQQVTGLPIIANGDIDSRDKARAVLDFCAADGVMIGRAALGKPWLFHEIRSLWDAGDMPEPPTPQRKIMLIEQHLSALYQFYGEVTGVRMARKHLAGYLDSLGIVATEARAMINRAEHPDSQRQALAEVLERFYFSMAVMA
ncbi:MAG: tRNA dihydrouridine synthase DusB [Methylococcales bacterium]|nr:tRNA dihydrouridine synthase DusB [Methylococcales bacterium]